MVRLEDYRVEDGRLMLGDRTIAVYRNGRWAPMFDATEDDIARLREALAPRIAAVRAACDQFAAALAEVARKMKPILVRIGRFRRPVKVPPGRRRALARSSRNASNPKRRRHGRQTRTR
jgi:hypothetical protein